MAARTGIRRQTWALAALPALSFVFGCLEYGPFRGPQAGSLLSMHAAAVLGLICVWFLLDARERAYRASIVLTIAMLALTSVALPYYLFRSRGFAGGVKATLRAVLMFAGTMAAYRIGSWFA